MSNDPVETARTNGNVLFVEASNMSDADVPAKVAKFKEAIAVYTRGIEDPAAQANERRKLLLGNRSACHNELGALLRGVATEEEEEAAAAAAAIHGGATSTNNNNNNNNNHNHNHNNGDGSAYVHHFKQALADAEAAILIDATYARAYYRAAQACHASGGDVSSSDDAMIFLDKLLDIDDEDQSVCSLAVAVEANDVRNKRAQMAVLNNTFVALRQAYLWWRDNARLDDADRPSSSSSKETLASILRESCGRVLLKRRDDDIIETVSPSSSSSAGESVVIAALLPEFNERDLLSLDDDNKSESVKDKKKDDNKVDDSSNNNTSRHGGLIAFLDSFLFDPQLLSGFDLMVDCIKTVESTMRALKNNERNKIPEAAKNWLDLGAALCTSETAQREQRPSSSSSSEPTQGKDAADAPPAAAPLAKGKILYANRIVYTTTGFLLDDNARDSFQSRVARLRRQQSQHLICTRRDRAFAWRRASTLVFDILVPLVAALIERASSNSSAGSRFDDVAPTVRKFWLLSPSSSSSSTSSTASRLLQRGAACLSCAKALPAENPKLWVLCDMCDCAFFCSKKCLTRAREKEGHVAKDGCGNDNRPSVCTGGFARKCIVDPDAVQRLMNDMSCSFFRPRDKGHGEGLACDNIPSEALLNGMQLVSGSDDDDDIEAGFQSATSAAAAATRANKNDEDEKESQERSITALAGIPPMYRAMMLANALEIPPDATSEQHDRMFATEIAAIRACTDMKLNARDPYGDGDQSDVSRTSADEMPTGRGGRLRNAWGDGCDFNPRFLSKFATDCMGGNYMGVRIALRLSDLTMSEEIAAQEKRKLVNRRESLLRLHSLGCVIAGARMANEQRDGAKYLATAKLLLEAGVDVNAKDIAGYSVAHHCTSAIANDLSLRILILATRYGNTKVDLSSMNRFGNRVLTEPAFQAHRPDVVTCLIQLGADPALTDRIHNLGMLTHQGMTTLRMSGGQTLDAMNHARPGAGLRPGDQVELYGLKKKKELNGMRGTVKDIDVRRYHIELEEGSRDDGGQQRVMSISVENVRRPTKQPSEIFASSNKSIIEVPLDGGGGDKSVLIMDVYGVPPVAGAQAPVEGKPFIIKAQVMPDEAEKQAPGSMIYDASRGVKFTLMRSGATAAAYQKLKAAVRKVPQWNGVKGFFYAMLVSGGNRMKISLEEAAPIQSW